MSPENPLVPRFPFSFSPADSQFPVVVRFSHYETMVQRMLILFDRNREKQFYNEINAQYGMQWTEIEIIVARFSSYYSMISLIRK